MARGDGDIVEDAEAHARLWSRVVSGRTHERVGIAHRAVEHGLEGRDAAAGRQPRDVDARVAEGAGAVSGVAPARIGALGGDAVEVCLRVTPQNVLVGGGLRREPDEVCR